MLICKLEPVPAQKGSWTVCLEDGISIRVTEAEVASFCLYAGKDLDGRTLAALSSAADLSMLKERAVKLVSMRRLSRVELIRKLTGKQGREEELAAVADWLEEIGLLNDAEYARYVVRHFSAGGYGIYKMKHELHRRGLPRELWEAALSELQDPAPVIDDFLSRKLNGGAGDRELRKSAGALARRGFAWSDISDGLRRFHIELDD